MKHRIAVTLFALPTGLAVLLLLLPAGCGKKKSTVDTDSASISESSSNGPGNPILQARFRNQSQNNLKQIGLAFHCYNDANGALPDAASCDETGKPLLSWRVVLLPFLDQQSLYQRFNLKEPWDGPTNKPLLALMPKTYANPGRTTEGDTITYYRVFAASNPPPSPEPLFTMPVAGQGKPQPHTLSGIIDGTSNTIMAVEAEEGVPWTKPDELIYAAKKPLPPLYYYANGSSQLLLADGSIRLINKSTSERTLRNAITIDDGAMPGSDW